VRLFFGARRRSQCGRGLECGSMSMENWSEMSRLFFKWFHVR